MTAIASKRPSKPNNLELLRIRRGCKARPEARTALAHGTIALDEREPISIGIQDTRKRCACAQRWEYVPLVVGRELGG